MAPQPELYGVERVEVLHGPASVLSGEGSPGGLVNVISKRPPHKPFAEILARIGSYGRYEAGFDIGGPLDAFAFLPSIAESFSGQHGDGKRIAFDQPAKISATSWTRT